VPTTLDVVDGEVRELIRRRGLDPFTDPGPVRVLVRDVVADYSERSLTSALPPIVDSESVVRDVLDRVAGFGPLQRYLGSVSAAEAPPGYAKAAFEQGRRRDTPATPAVTRRTGISQPPVLAGQQLRAFGEGSLWPTKIRVDGAVGKRLA
jgi:hypothetical protein